jgi:hypothetical protein
MIFEFVAMNTRARTRPAVELESAMFQLVEHTRRERNRSIVICAQSRSWPIAGKREKNITDHESAVNDRRRYRIAYTLIKPWRAIFL